MWQTVTKMLKEADNPISDDQFTAIYYLLKPLIQQLVEHYYHKSIVGNIVIPKSDFQSFFLEILWESIQSFQKNPALSFKKILLHRIKLKNFALYRKAPCFEQDYSVISDSNAESTANDALSGNNLTEIQSLESKITLKMILMDFKKQYPSESNLIDLLIAGWTPAEVAQIAYHDSNYSALSRQKICRLRHLFRQFYKQYQ